MAYEILSDEERRKKYDQVPVNDKYNFYNLIKEFLIV